MTRDTARVTVIYDVDGWAYHHRARALQKHAPPDFEVSLVGHPSGGRPGELERLLGDCPVDVIFCLPAGPLRPVRDLIRKRGWSTRLVGAWSNGWPYRLSAYDVRRSRTDLLIVNNREYWERAGRLPGTRVLPNGVDLDVFRVTVPIERRAPRVLWTGSAYFRAVKGYDEYIVPLQRGLQAKGIECETLLVDSRAAVKRSPSEMAAWYNSGTILVCASESEGTPNPALEAAACGCTIVSTPVGNLPELIRSGVNGYLAEREVTALLAAIEAANRRYTALAREMLRSIEAWSWAKRSLEYFEVFRDLLAGGPEARAPAAGAEATRDGRGLIACPSRDEPDDDLPGDPRPRTSV